MGGVESTSREEEEEEKSADLLRKPITSHPLPYGTNLSWGQDEDEELSHIIDKFSFFGDDDEVESGSPIVNPITPQLIYFSLCYTLTEVMFPNAKTPKALGPATRKLEEDVGKSAVEFWCEVVAIQLKSGSKKITPLEGLSKEVQQKMIDEVWRYAITPFKFEDRLQSVEEQKAMLDRIMEGE